MWLQRNKIAVFSTKRIVPVIGKIRRLRQQRRRQIIKKNEITLLHLGQTSWSLSHLPYVSTLQWYHSRRRRFCPYLPPNLRSSLRPSPRSLSLLVFVCMLRKFCVLILLLDFVLTTEVELSFCLVEEIIYIYNNRPTSGKKYTWRGDKTIGLFLS